MAMYISLLFSGVVRRAYKDATEEGLKRVIAEHLKHAPSKKGGRLFQVG